MARRVREHDWAATPLGAIETWSPELRFAAAFVLENHTPAALIWGPDLVPIYNDGFRAMLGGKPEALGRSFADIWSEAWHEIGPMAERAFAGHSAFVEDYSLDVNRSGTPERAFFTFSYSPVRAADGTVLGIVVMVVETTARVKAQSDLQAGEERFRALVMASSEVVYRMSPDWTEMRLLVGRDFIADTHKPSQTWLQKYIHPDDQPHVLAAINEAIRSKSVFELEHRVLRVDGSLGWTVSRAVPILDATGEITDWFGMANDITARKQVEEALRRSEERLRRVSDNADVGLTRCSRDWRYLSANPAYAKIAGKPVDQIVGRPIAEVMGAEAARRIQPYVERVLRGEHVVYETEMPFAGAGERWLHVSYAPDTEAAGRIVGWVACVTDLTERKRAEEALRDNQAQLAHAMQRLRTLGALSIREGNLTEILGEIVEAAVAIGGADMGDMRLLDPETGNLRIVAQRGFAEWWLAYWDNVSRGRSAWETALERGERIIVEDVDKSPIFVGTPALDIQRRAGVRAVQSTPLVGRSGQVLGIFSTHFRTPHRPDERVLRLLDLLARQAADIIGHQRAETTIRASEERLRTIVDTATYAIIVIDETGRIESVNPATARIFGYTPTELVGRNVSMLMGEPHLSAHDGYLRSFLNTGKANVIGIGREVEARRKDGTIFPADLAVAEWRLDGKRWFTGFVHDITQRRQSEAQIRLLLKEVNHRVKNLLGVVEAIALQTAAANPEEFIERFSDRIQALATNQDLLVRSQWQGLELADLVRGQLGHLDNLIGNRVVIEGPPLHIAADAAQAIAMALHELATNAAKFGALSSREGEVRITWAIDGGDCFRLSWSERGGPEVRMPSRRGFGTTIISDMPRMQLDADVALDFARSGVTWRMVCAANTVLENDGIKTAENE